LEEAASDRLQPAFEPARETAMKEDRTNSLSLEVEEIESRQRAAGSCTSSTTSRMCTCLCKLPTTTSILCGGGLKQ
jgi:hypothetical protein